MKLYTVCKHKHLHNSGEHYSISADSFFEAAETFVKEKRYPGPTIEVVVTNSSHTKILCLVEVSEATCDVVESQILSDPVGETNIKSFGFEP